MLIVNIRELREKLPALIQSRLHVAIIGPPGTGKTYNSIVVAQEMGLCEVLDGGQENEWKGLFPYKTPTNGIELGRALRASGYLLEAGEVVKTFAGGTLVIDEFNRVPPEMKTAFQLLASQRIVPWPSGGSRKTDLAIIATANDTDLGVEEAARAELDRYTVILRLIPAPGEIMEIIAMDAGITVEAAKIIYEAVERLRGKLDSKKFHLPEGIRLAVDTARLLKADVFGAKDSFLGTAERCFPLGRRGSEKFRGEFDAAVLEIAQAFAGRIANVNLVGNVVVPSQAAQAAAAAAPGVPTTLWSLGQFLYKSTEPEVTSAWLELPSRFSQNMPVFQRVFGAGVALHLMKNMATGSESERAGVRIAFGKGKEPDKIRFNKAPRYKVVDFIDIVDSFDT